MSMGSENLVPKVASNWLLCNTALRYPSTNSLVTGCVASKQACYGSSVQCGECGVLSSPSTPIASAMSCVWMDVGFLVRAQFFYGGLPCEV